MIITYVSEVNGQTGLTSNVTAAAIKMAITYGIRVLVVDTQLTFSRLEKIMLEKEFVNNELRSIDNLNIDTFLRDMQFKKNISIHDYTLTLLKDRLDILPSTRHSNGEIFVNTMEEGVKQFVDAIQKYYDVVLIDLHHYNLMYQKYLMNVSDAVIVNVNQNIEVLEKTFTSSRLKDFESKIIYCIGNYEEASRYNLKNIKRKFNLRNPIYAVPHNIGFMDACNDSRAIEYIMRSHKSIKKDSNYYFQDMIKQFVEGQLAARKDELNLNYKEIG